MSVEPFRLPPDKLSPVTDPAIAYGLHDAGQAQRFVESFGGRIRFDHRRRIWLTWHGSFWAVDRDGEPKRLAIELASDLYRHAQAESNLKAREAIARFSIQQQARRKVDDVLELAKVLPPIAESGDRWNADPFALATAAGVIDLRTGHRRAGHADDLISLCAAANYDPRAECPRWTQFQSEVFPDATVRHYVQRAIGYSATADVREQVVFLCYGSGANGKSTLLDTIAYVLGDYAYACPFSTFEAGQRSEIGADVAALAGRRFVTSSETNAHSRFNEARLKAISGGDKLNARHLYGNPFEFHPVCKVWLGVNHRPAVSDDSFGFWRRLHLIPFTRTFAGIADDKGLKNALRGEAAGILNWIVEGSRKWLADGLSPPEAVMAARAEYQRENDPIAEFLDEACHVDTKARCSASQLYGAYCAWCDRQNVGRNRLNNTKFGELMSRRFERKHTEAGRCYFGVELRRRPG